MNPEIFREYDIRGIVGKDITENDAVSIGKAYGTMIKKKRKGKGNRGKGLQKQFHAFFQTVH